jgi:ferredoxin
MDKTVITAFDGKLSVTLETPLCIDCSEQPDPEIDEFLKLLRVRRYDGGRVSGTRWYLTQGNTYKRNVKIIDTGAIGGDIARIVPALIEDLRALSEPGQQKTAFVDIKKCAFCYTCYRVCPHSALKPDDKAAAMKVDELLCSACGICVAVCPASAITFTGGEDAEESAAKTKKLKIFAAKTPRLSRQRKRSAEWTHRLNPYPAEETSARRR